jgi:hypothetical protein
MNENKQVTKEKGKQVTVTEMVNKVAVWVIKAAGLIVCAPATWDVAGATFTTWSQYPVFYVIIRLAAVLLVEGVMLSNWLLLEYDVTAQPQIKSRYALTALGMYIGVWIVSLQHGEGVTGLVFRLALGAALLSSAWDTLIVTFQRQNASADRNIVSHWSVKRHKRRAEIRDAKKQIDAEFSVTDRRRAARQNVTLRHIEQREKSRLSELLHIAAPAPAPVPSVPLLDSLPRRENRIPLPPQGAGSRPCPYCDDGFMSGSQTACSGRCRKRKQRNDVRRPEYLN